MSMDVKYWHISVHTYVQQKDSKKNILESTFSDSCVSFTISPVTCNITIIISVQVVSLLIYTPQTYAYLDLKDLII